MSSAARNRKDPPRNEKMEQPSPATEPTSISSLSYDLLSNCLARVSRLCHLIKEQPSPATEPTSISSLPYDLLLNCLARVSRLYHPTLSLVSNKFRSIVASPDLYKTRSLINRTESCLYLCLHYDRDPKTHWYTLCKDLNRSVTSKCGNIFVPIPSPNYPSAKPSSIVAVGSNIYQIGGASRTKVSVLDCRSHTWQEAPRLRELCTFSTASQVDGKIYVVGGCRDCHCLNWVEVFDPKTQTWDSVTNPRPERCDENRMVKSLGLEGKFYLFGDEDVVYNPKEGVWNPIGVDKDLGYIVGVHYVTSDATTNCVIDDVMFSYDGILFIWYDFKVSLWKKLNGLERFPDLGRVEIFDLGGKMAVLFFEYKRFSDDVNIWCAQIALERRNGDEIWGKIEWFDVVLTLNVKGNLRVVDVVSATV